MIDIDKEMQGFCSIMSEVLNEIYGQKMAFFCCVAPFRDEGGIADYVSNASRQTAIDWMRETAKRLENKEFIPSPVHEA